MGPLKKAKNLKKKTKVIKHGIGLKRIRATCNYISKYLYNKGVQKDNVWSPTWAKIKII
jgi:hypothetical protein